MIIPVCACETRKGISSEKQVLYKKTLQLPVYCISIKKSNRYHCEEQQTLFIVKSKHDINVLYGKKGAIFVLKKKLIMSTVLGLT